MKQKRSRTADVAIVTVLSIVAVTILLPLILMVLNSFKDIYEYMRDPLALPQKLNMKNYIAMYSVYKVQIYFKNSILVSGISLAVSLVVSVYAAYAFAKLKFKGNKVLYLAILSLMMIPGMVTLIPRYIMYSKIGLIDNPLSLIISYSVGSLPFTLYLLTANFKGIPNDMIEAGKVDGTSFSRIIWSIAVPMGKPAIITVAIINFVNFWNELIQAMLFINSDKYRTITAVVSNMGTRFISNMPMIMTGLTLASIPMILVYIIFERYIEEGITVGSVK